MCKSPLAFQPFEQVFLVNDDFRFQFALIGRSRAAKVLKDVT